MSSIPKLKHRRLEKGVTLRFKKMGKFLNKLLTNNKPNRYQKLDQTLDHPFIKEKTLDHHPCINEDYQEYYWTTSEDPKILNNYEIDDNYVCEICFESKPLDDSFGVKGCTHFYCIDCTVKYIRSKLDSNETHITCPEANCPGILDPDFCREILPADLFYIWGKTLWESAVNGSEKVNYGINDDDYVCEICLKSRPLDDSFGVKGCSHFYCIDCIVKYIRSKLDYNNETHITCPEANCPGVLDPDFCREILPTDLLYKWGKALCESALNDGSETFYCPYSDCSALLIKDPLDVLTELPCPACKRYFCLHCKVASHSTSDCREFEKLKKLSIVDNYVCDFCLESRPLDESFSVKGCTHFYCIDCTVKYIRSKLDNNETHITCPEANCQGLLDPDFCREILPADLFYRWGKALCESAVNGSEKFYCPHSDCSALLIKDPLEVLKELPCPACKRHFCVQCKVAWHSGMDCTEFQKLKKLGTDGLLADLAKKKNWMQCPNPKCKFYVEKLTGCNFIKCRCGHAFCYKCGTPSDGKSHLCSKCKH